MQVEWVDVFEAPDALAANSVLALLAEAQLPARLIRLNGGLGEAIIGSAPLGAWASIQVEDASVERALELIGGFLGTMGLLEEAVVEDQG